MYRFEATLIDDEGNTLNKGIEVELTPAGESSETMTRLNAWEKAVEKALRIGGEGVELDSIEFIGS